MTQKTLTLANALNKLVANKKLYTKKEYSIKLLEIKSQLQDHIITRLDTETSFYNLINSVNSNSQNRSN